MRSLALAALSLAAALALCEAALWALERAASAPLPEVDAGSAPPPPDLPEALRAKIARMQGAFVMPSEWDHVELEQRPGVRRPYRWHGALHVFDADRMRRDAPFPPRDPGRFRVIVVGDSFTYGEGVAAEWTYPAQLERALAPDFDVEVLNLGVLGSESADVTRVTRDMLPRLAPDLVVYGVCLNDFQDVGQFVPGQSAVPLPAKWRKALARNTRTGRLVAERYQALLRRLRLGREFYRELGENFDARRARFARDVAELNAFVVASGRPPVVALVLDHLRRGDDAAKVLVDAAESALRDAGAEVIASGDVFADFAGRDFRVSRWEGHPNEEAHAIWAARLARQLRSRADLARFGRD